MSLTQSFKKIDLITVQNELEKNDELETIGGMSYLITLQEDIPSLGLLQQHAQIVKEKAILRELIYSATQIITNCYDQNDKEI